MKEKIHERVCGPHTNGHMLAKKIIRQAYSWMTLQHNFRIAVFNVTNWYHRWSSFKVFEQNRYIVVAIDYFTKWVDAASYTKLMAKGVAKFVKKKIAY